MATPKEELSWPFTPMVEQGLADADAKRSISNEEMGRRIRSWRK